MSNTQTSRHEPESRSGDRGFFARILKFVREVIGELKKVKWPGKEEWWTYFLVVLVFVGAVMAFTGLLDIIFGQLSIWIFS
ncbi:MAG: preprotein translocase subunit SecE [Actinomycetaceae bacterium]|nr:preprotein translocase subunit SecE [Actinomycetaceae bacterium]